MWYPENLGNNTSIDTLSLVSTEDDRFDSRENFLKAPIRPETVKKLVVSGNVDDVSHRLYVQHLREIQAKREYQLQKIGHDEQTFLLADIQAHEDEESDESKGFCQ
jgi:hypothetical protein